MVQFEPSRASLDWYIRTKIVACWVRTAAPGFQRLSLSVFRETLSYLPTYRFYPFLASSKLYLYDIDKGECLNLGLSLRAAEGARCALESRDSVLVTGGSPETCRALRVAIETATATEIESMREARSYHGVVYYRDFLWVFGGISERRSAERLGSHWESIGNMRYPRVYFTPCAANGKIYLPEISPCSKPFEVLDTARLEFTVLPFCVESTHPRSVACLLSDELVLITQTGALGRWCVDTPHTPMSFIDVASEMTAEVPPSAILVHTGRWVDVVAGERYSLRIDLRPVNRAVV